MTAPPTSAEILGVPVLQVPAVPTPDRDKPNPARHP